MQTVSLGLIIVFKIINFQTMSIDYMYEGLLLEDNITMHDIKTLVLLSERNGDRLSEGWTSSAR